MEEPRFADEPCLSNSAGRSRRTINLKAEEPSLRSIVTAVPLVSTAKQLLDGFWKREDSEELIVDGAGTCDTQSAN